MAPGSVAGSLVRPYSESILSAMAWRSAGTPGMVLDDDFAIACGSDAIRPLRLQRAGKPVLERSEFLRGRAVASGTVLT